MVDGGCGGIVGNCGKGKEMIIAAAASRKAIDYVLYDKK